MMLGSFFPKKAIPRVWIPFGGAWPWICLRNGAGGQGEKQKWEIRECCQKLGLGGSLWESLWEWGIQASHKTPHKSGKHEGPYPGWNHRLSGCVLLIPAPSNPA